MEIFSTIITGVSVFVVGQIFVRLVLEPVISFKEEIGLIENTFVSSNETIDSFSASRDMVKSLNKHCGLLLSKKRAIPAYRLSAWAFRLPKEESVYSGCKHIKELSKFLSYVLDESENNNIEEDSIVAIKDIKEMFVKIEKTLGVVVTINQIA